MSKWEDKLHTIRALAGIGVDSATIADLVGTTIANLQTVAKRNGIKLPGGVTSAAGLVCDVPVELLRRDPQQPREQFDENALRELAESLKVDGQETPIRFRVADDDGTPFIIVHGERRWRAAQIAGLATMQGVLDTREDTPADRILRQIADNEQRAALTPWDWIVAIGRLVDSGMKHAEISEKITARGIKGFSRPVVSNYSRLAQLPPMAIDLLKSGKITPAHGKYLLQCKDERIRNSVVASLSASDDVGTVERLQWKIEQAYQQAHRGLNCWGKGERCHFDWEQTCKSCDHLHKVGTDYRFCTDPVSECFNGHQFAAERRRAVEREAAEQAEADEEAAIIGMDLDELKSRDPEEAARIEKMLAERHERELQRAEHEHQVGKRNALVDEIKKRTACCGQIDTLIVIAMRYLLEDMAAENDGQDLNLGQWHERFKLDLLGMLKKSALDSLDGYIDPAELTHLARMLDIDPDGDYREDNPQMQLEEDAA